MSFLLPWEERCRAATTSTLATCKSVAVVTFPHLTWARWATYRLTRTTTSRSITIELPPDGARASRDCTLLSLWGSGCLTVDGDNHNRHWCTSEDRVSHPELLLWPFGRPDTIKNFDWVKLSHFLCLGLPRQNYSSNICMLHYALFYYGCVRARACVHSCRYVSVTVDRACWPFMHDS